MDNFVDNLAPNGGHIDDDTVVGAVTQRLVDAIVSGKLAPGEKLSEPELAQRWGTSRGSLREALHRLEGMRLLERRPRRSARVATVGTVELAQLYAVREALEGLACRLAAERMSAREADAIRELLARHENRADVKADVGYFQDAEDDDFHVRIVHASRNVELIALLEGLSYRVRLYRYRSSHISHRPQRALTEHRQILDAIEAGDGELAEMLMKRHISAARRSVEPNLPESTAVG